MHKSFINFRYIGKYTKQPVVSFSVVLRHSGKLLTRVHWTLSCQAVTNSHTYLDKPAAFLLEVC